MASPIVTFVILLLTTSSVVAADPAPSSTMATQSSDASKAVVQRLFRALQEGDLDALNSLVAPVHKVHTPTETRTRPGGLAKTLAEACPLCARLNPREVTVDFVVAEGDLITVRSTFRGKYTGTVRDIAISGKDVTLHYTNTYRISKGQIAEYWVSFDRLQLLEQIGFSVSPPAQ